MCCGVTRGLAFEKLSGSLKISGKNETIMSKNKIISVNSSRSL